MSAARRLAPLALGALGVALVAPARAQDCPSTVVRVDNDIAGSGYSEDPAANWVSRPTGACHGTYRYLSHTVGDGSRRGRAIWRPTIPRAGWYEVVTRFRATENRTPDADYVLYGEDGEVIRRSVDQRGDGCTAATIGVVRCVPGGACRLVLDGTDDALSDSADLTTFTLVSCDGPPSPPTPGGGACDGIAARPGLELCVSEADRCEGVFTGGEGCDAFCAAAGMVCAEAFGGEPGCAREAQNPLPCGVDSGHQSDWCVCRPAGPPPPPPPPPMGEVCDPIEAAGFELCRASEDGCAGVFTGGEGCTAFCAAAGMECVARRGGEPGCREEAQNPQPCEVANGHLSDWCECAPPSSSVPPPPPPPAPRGQGLERVGEALTWCGTPVRLIGYGQYGLVAESAFDHARFFDTLQARHGLNLVRVWGQYHWANDLSPFAGPRGDQDLTAPNPAFYARLRRVVEDARARGVVVMLTLFDSVQLEGSATDGNRWRYSPYRDANNRQAYLSDPTHFDRVGPTAEPPVWREVNQPYLERMVDTVCDLPNVIYEVMNEPEGSGGDPGRGGPELVDAVIAELDRLLARPGCTGSRLIASNDQGLRTARDPRVDVITVHVGPERAGDYASIGKPVIVSNDGDDSQVSDAFGFGRLSEAQRIERLRAYAAASFARGAPGVMHLEILDKDLHGASWLGDDYEPRAERASEALLGVLATTGPSPLGPCGGGPDGGVADAALPPPDAGPSRADAAGGAADAGAAIDGGTALTGANGGCGCAAVPADPPPSAGLGVALFALLGAVRRRRG